MARRVVAMDGRPQFWPMWPIDCMAQVRGLDDGSGRRPTAKPNTRMQPHRPDRVNQERQQGKEKIHAAGAALDYRARGLTGESIHELLARHPGTLLICDNSIRAAELRKTRQGRGLEISYQPLHGLPDIGGN